MEEKEEKKMPENLEKNKKQANAYLRYASISLQMIIMIGGATFLGMRLDEYFEIEAVCTVICSLMGVGLASYVLIRQAIGENNPSNKR